jgi:hypothetical protein
MKQDDIQRTINMLRHTIPVSIAQSIVGVQPIDAGSFFAPHIPKVTSKSKYQFSRAKWHTVDIGDGVWRLSREYNEIIKWCTEHFGKHPNKPDAWSRWWVGLGVINFRDEKDFVFYQLKWS